MKFLILLLSLVSFSAFAQTSEPSWKASLRNLISKINPNAAEYFLGKPPVPPAPFEMPEIPKNFQKNTDTSTYYRVEKEATEYDRLPTERKRTFDYKFLEELFMATRKSEPRDEDLSNWLNTLDQGGSREGIYQALVLDDVYATLENMEESPTDRLINFSQNFASKYLHLNYDPKVLRKNNLYTLKRTLTEKGLDLMEYYESKDLDSLYRWYALLSAELGREYSPLLQNDVRKDPTPEFHYAWAKSMPLQHIKSEFIIKMHTVMNGLQLLQ